MNRPVQDSRIETPASPQEHNVDQLRERYRIEREKRQRSDGMDQYIEVTGSFAHFADDPYIEQPITREPLTRDCEVLVIGGGFGGMLMAARLRQAGLDDLCIIEKGGDFGGTWYWNRYPGARCDVESYIYLPLLEEVGYMPAEKYATAAEIFAYSQQFGRHFDLYRAALFQTSATEVRWDDSRCRWVVSTQRGDRICARFIAMANGPMSRPKLPGVPGITDFEGHIFHTSRWDYGYTGGDASGGLDKLADKKVAVIGTGATAIQVVPQTASYAEHLYVFQRTPSTVGRRDNGPTDPEWAESLTPGWQKKRMENFNQILAGAPLADNLVGDEWTRLLEPMLRRMREPGVDPADRENLAALAELGDFDKMEEMRDRIERAIDNPAVAEALKPYYQLFCKRPTFSDEYLDAFNRPNVTLVNTAGTGVEKITRSGIVVAGREYPVDCIILATGFQSAAIGYTRRNGYEIIGRQGKKLTDHWAQGLRSLHGCTSHGYPNAFFLMSEQAGITINFPHLLDEMTSHVAHIIAHARATQSETVEATEAGERDWIEAIVNSGTGNGMVSGPECTPGYYNNEGQPKPDAVQSAPFGGYGGRGTIKFFKLIEKWRESGQFNGLEFKGRGTTTR